MIDFDLFTPPPPTLPYQSHSETSKQAAKRERIRQDAFKWQVLAVFMQYRTDSLLPIPRTDDDLYKIFPTAKQGTVRARRIGLVQEGYLKDNGTKRGGCVEWMWTGLKPKGDKNV